MRAAATFLILAFFVGDALAAEVNFIGVSVSGKPVQAEVWQRRMGESEGKRLIGLDERGLRKLAKFDCTVGLQFRARDPKWKVFIPKEDWEDCRYGDIRFVFNEVEWASTYVAAVVAINKLALEGSMEIRFEALVAASALETGDYGKLAFATSQLQAKLKPDDQLRKGLQVVEKDAIAQAVGVRNGILVAPDGGVTFAGATLTAFQSLAAQKKLPTTNIEDPKLKAFLAAEDYKTLKLQPTPYFIDTFRSRFMDVPG